MTDQQDRPDAYSGIPWVHVPREKVLAHPKGRLSPALWAIAGFFVLSALFKMGFLVVNGAGILAALALGLWPLLTGIGLMLRVPWALVMAVISAGVSLFVLVRGLGQEASWVLLAEMLINAGIVFYLMDGDRPNFIYRHRYRKYSALKDTGGHD